MRITVKINGHQYYREITGEVIKFCEGVGDFDQVPRQVPAVMLDTGTEIEIVNLQQYLRWIDVLKDESALQEKPDG